MSLEPLQYAPGVCKVQSPYAARNRITDMDGCRFVAGFPEQIGDTDVYSTDFGGDSKFNGGPLADAFDTSGGESWSDFAGNKYLALGDPRGFLRIMESEGGNLARSGNFDDYIDATPLRPILTGTLTNPLDTIINSTLVTVHHTAHGLVTGDFVELVTGTPVGGIQPIGVFAPVTVSSSSVYTFNNILAATANITGGGGTVSYVYYRVTLSNPFTTVLGQSRVKVTHTAHGAIDNDFVYIMNATAVGGITIQDGVYEIEYIDANNYYILFAFSSQVATSSTTGGGTPNFQYAISADSLTALISVFTTLQWSLHNYGQQLLANPCGGTIYVWDPITQGHAYPLYNAPPSIFSMFVTAERFIFALGTPDNPKLVQWPDQSDPTAWTPLPTNTANQRTLQSGNTLRGGISVRDGVSLVFTDTTPYSFTYTGDTFIYADAAAGENCGLVGPDAVSVMDEIAYWFSGLEFYSWNGTTIRLPSDDIRDFIVSTFNTFYKESNDKPELRFIMGTHSAKNEVWGFYASGENFGSNDKSLIFHPSQGCWSLGTVPRQMWLDGKTFGFPISVGDVFNQDPNFGGSRIFFMDTNGYNSIQTQIDSQAIFVQGSPIEIASGNADMDIMSIIPDFERITSTINMLLYTQQHPMDTPTLAATLPITTSTSILDPRVSGKLISFTLTQTDTDAGSDFRAGLFRADVQQAGARR